MRARVYLPLTALRLRAAREQGCFGPAPLAGHAVTPSVAAALDDEEEREYAALTAASLAAIDLLSDDDPPLRLVAAVDADEWEPADRDDDATAVRLPHAVPWRRLAAVLADSDHAADAVARARAAGPGREDAVEACLNHELGWFAVQEVDALLDVLGV